MEGAPHIADHLRYWACNRPQLAAAEFASGPLSWAALDAGSDELANGLLGIGLNPGDRVAALLDSTPEFVELVAACIKAGLILCPLNVRLTAPELLHQIQDSGAAVLLTAKSPSLRLEPAAHELGALPVYCMDAHAGRDFRCLRSAVGPAQRRFAPDDGLFLCYTSGTTGLPKAALLSHGGVRAAGLAKQIADGITHRDRVWSMAPLCLTAGLVTNLVQISFLVGATIVFGSAADPEQALAHVVSQRITTMAMVPLMLERMSQTEAFAHAELSGLQHVTTGGPDLTAELVARYAQRGVSLDPSFGQTEASSIVTWSRRRDMGDRLHASGRAIPHTEVRIFDEDDRALPAGQAGEIVVRGPGVMRGYWRRPDETATALRNGWLHTGDIGFLDEQSYLTVCDRKKDMIRSGGFNVYPAEVEQALLPALAATAEIAVVGVPDPRWGEVGLLVVGGDPRVDIDALRRRMQATLAGYKQPRYCVVIDEALPRNATGKIRKVDLRQRFASLPASAIRLKD